MIRSQAFAAALALLLSPLARAGEVTVAVATNFTAPMQRIARAFEADTGHKALLSFGSTGKLYAQIRHGGPYDLLLAADTARPQRLEAEGAAVAGSRFTYAVGRLVLWSPDPQRIDAEGRVLSTGDFRHLAIANPKTAPYGAAAMEAMVALGVQDRLAERLVQGENIGQAWQFVATGNAELGFVAAAQLFDGDQPLAGSRWEVPQTLYAPIRQDAVLLKRGADKPAARALIDYLKGETARGIIQIYGYGLH